MRFAALPTVALFAVLLLTPVAPLLAADPPTPPDAAGLEFFEKKIRPVLAQHCASCHSADAAKNKKLKGGLYVDSRDGLLAGGDSGVAVVPGQPGESLLLKTMKYDGDLQMPPKGKLPDAVLKDFETWIAVGAPDPRGGTGAAKKQVGLTVEEGRKFWAYKLPGRPALPEVRNNTEVRNGIDAFVLARLEAKGLGPAPEADRATLVRRLYYDLTGLPPSPEEADAFVSSQDPAAYEKLVDRLLASPAFGERWGRHWLDVARYAESVTLRGTVFKEAWRYRDYVIDAFNADVPFDQLIKEQLAGDLLPSAGADRARALVATTFLQLGNTNLEEQDKKQLRMDVVDEQLDVITKGFLGQTVTCARCHDHKFDPIPTKDYYALAGILRNVRALETANVSKWVEVPLPAAPEHEAALKKHEAAVAALQSKVAAAKAKAGPKVASGVLAVADVPGVVVDDAQAKKVGAWTASTHNSTYIGTGYAHDADAGKGEKTLTFQPDALPAGKYEVRLAYAPGANRAGRVPVHVFSADGEKAVEVNMQKNPPLDGRYVSLGEHRFEKGGQAYVIVSNEDTKGHVCPDAVVFLPLDKKEPTDPKAAKPQPDEAKALEAELKKLQEGGPKRALAMSVLEEKVIEDTKVHVRGNVHNLGEAAPRGYLTVALYGPPPAVPKTQSGRKELAEWIASRDNPLTARVFANRAWHWLFGAGLVRTTDNFGVTGELPSNPELLDHLATLFQSPPGGGAGGMNWSAKKLVRYIVLSRTYRQSATGARATAAADPENRLYGRANRRRLEAEAIRDTVLVVSGRLDPARGGATFPMPLAADYAYKSTSHRRSVYLPAFRNAIPEMLDVFDLADPSTVTGTRNSSTVAPQALFMMNHPFVHEQSRAAAARLLGEKHLDDAARLARAYRLALGRGPTDGEREVAHRFLNSKNEPDAWAALYHALFASAEFRYVN